MNKTPVWKGLRGTIVPRSCAGIMGIVNLTPDSFYDGGRHNSPEDGLAYARQLLLDGADIVDLGGESSRPGSAPVDSATETGRLMPVIDRLRAMSIPPLISVDTYHAETAVAVLESGVDVINDISAFAFDPALLDVLVQYRPGYVLLHCQGVPGTMQQNPHYNDVVSEVTAFFEEKMNVLVNAGFPEENILLDPGIGFGKKMEHNLALMAHPEAWERLGRPSLMALSMKSVFNDLLGLPVESRGPATQTATALCYTRGYAWHRVHDARAASQALRLADAFMNA